MQLSKAVGARSHWLASLGSGSPSAPLRPAPHLTPAGERAAAGWARSRTREGPRPGGSRQPMGRGAARRGRGRDAPSS